MFLVYFIVITALCFDAAGDCLKPQRYAQESSGAGNLELLGIIRSGLFSFLVCKPPEFADNLLYGRINLHRWRLPQQVEESYVQAYKSFGVYLSLYGLFAAILPLLTLQFLARSSTGSLASRPSLSSARYSREWGQSPLPPPPPRPSPYET